jgi:transcriptional repressor NrdR
VVPRRSQSTRAVDRAAGFRDDSGVICPYCNANDDKVIDSRASEGGKVIRRRRECLKCGKRFTTYERVEQAAKLIVAKHDGRREPFRRENILRGVEAACGKRKIAEEVKQRLVDEIEEEVHREFDREVPSAEIGRRVMRKLLDVDEVAYIRFASEYMNFRDGHDIRKELEELDKRVKDVKSQQSLF